MLQMLCTEHIILVLFSLSIIFSFIQLFNANNYIESWNNIPQNMPFSQLCWVQLLLGAPVFSLGHLISFLKIIYLSASTALVPDQNNLPHGTYSLKCFLDLLTKALKLIRLIPID